MPRFFSLSLIALLAAASTSYVQAGQAGAELIGCQRQIASLHLCFAEHEEQCYGPGSTCKITLPDGRNTKCPIFENYFGMPDCCVDNVCERKMTDYKNCACRSPTQVPADCGKCVNGELVQPPGLEILCVEERMAVSICHRYAACYYHFDCPIPRKQTEYICSDILIYEQAIDCCAGKCAAESEVYYNCVVDNVENECLALLPGGGTVHANPMGDPNAATVVRGIP